MTATLPSPVADVATTYDRTAPYFDRLTRHDDYDRYTVLVDEAIRRAAPPSLRFLDVGCGTGRSSVHFRAAGYAVTGLDASPAMIERARARTDAGDIDFHVADARVPFRPAAFGVVNCTSDVVNYMLTPADLAAAFGAAAYALRPGGLMVFDLNTQDGYELASSQTQVLDDEEALIVLRGRWAGGGERRFELVLDVFEADAGAWRRETIVHRQAHHEPAAIDRALRHAGLVPEQVYALDGGHLRPMREVAAATKLIYLARRVGPAGS